MPKDILRDEVQRLIERGAQLLDVLEISQYRDSHLPGAVHIHLRKLKQQAPTQLDAKRPVIVYCWDFA